MKVAIYARVSTHNQQTLPLQIEDLRNYALKRNWEIVQEVKDTVSGINDRPKRETLLKLARKRKIDAILVWKLDRWGRSVADLITTINELNELGVGFISYTEALDLTTPIGRALAGMLAVFADFEREVIKERIKAGIAKARKEGKPHGRPKTAALKAKEVKNLFSQGLNKSQIAKELNIGRSSVVRILSK